MNTYEDKDKKNDESELFSSIKELPGGDNDKNNIVTAAFSGCGASLLICVIFAGIITVSGIRINDGRGISSVIVVLMLSVGIGVYKLVSKKHSD